MMEAARLLSALLLVSAAAPWAPAARGEMFTALVHMEGLLELEKELLSGLNEYIAAEKRRLQVLEAFSSRVQKAMEAAGDDLSAHLFDPVNAFQLVNRYTNGWMKLHDTIYQDNSGELMSNISMQQYRFPSSDDYSGAITALWRLQDTYKLEPSTIASGKLGSTTSVPMSAHDCFLIGRMAYDQQHWAHSRGWMLEALRNFDEEGAGSDLDLGEVYDHLAFSEFKLGNMKRSAMYTRDLLQYIPDHKRALSNMATFEQLRDENPEIFVDAEPQNVPSGDPLMEKYEALCREAKPIPSEDHHKLTCFYYTNKNNPRLILRPAKVEVAFPNPKVYILRDIISEPEMARLKELAEPKLDRATVREKDGTLVFANYRISKRGWLSPEDDPLGYVQRVDQRIEDVTGLTMETAEELQVVNYGIGGHYAPHYDFATHGEDAFSYLGTGNRMATVLFYMSDVELGGATVFPLVGARIPPTVGDAAFWWNLKKSGEGDYLTRHAGCPVLVGSKWVCNKWIHERGQEFRRPCGLSPDV